MSSLQLPFPEYEISDSHIKGRGIEAEGHTAVYKMHKYFARRPPNVFNHLIRRYSKPEDVILDTFCGGGVTLFEALSLGRKVVAVDINPLATFITDCQTTAISPDEYLQVVNDVRSKVKLLADEFYTTNCRYCGRQAPVRWYELAYTAHCGSNHCKGTTLLSNKQKATRNGRQVDGKYVCQVCGSEFASVDAVRQGYELVSVTYRCVCESERQTVAPSAEDCAIMNQIDADFDELIRKNGLWYPTNGVPAEWDRQQEDCLHRKGVLLFSDMFTRRGLFFNAYMLKCFQSYRDTVSPDLYKMLVFTFSAIIRHTNSLTISTGGWMDGRPVSWSKHAYWIPNQFVEVNPLEYIDKRQQAIVSGMKHQQSALPKSTRVFTFSDLANDFGTHMILTQSSSHLPIPDNSISAIVTDPPYGSNVQYGELSHYWLVWLQNELAVGDLFKLNDEILVNRKTKAKTAKDYTDYMNGLTNVFREGYRVLKPGGALVFTFNNRDLRAWYAVTKAVTAAGFQLDPDGVIYQDAVENYKNTAHLKYAGALHGDFIYSFRKPSEPSANMPPPPDMSSREFQDKILQAAHNHLLAVGKSSTNELYVVLFTSMAPLLVDLTRGSDKYAQAKYLFESGTLESILEEQFEFNASDKTWHIKRA